MTGVGQLTGQKRLSPVPVLREFRFDENIGGRIFGLNARLKGDVVGIGAIEVCIGDSEHG